MKSSTEILGLRPGEALKCIHSNEFEGGCGTTECCSVCGTVQAILECQEKKTPVSKECHMTSNFPDGMKSFDFLVYASPIGDVRDDYTVFVIKDIGEEKRKKIFGKVFFHDILNTSGIIKGFIDMLRNSTSLDDIKELTDYASEGIEVLLEEIISQKQLLEAENGELKLSINEFSVMEIVEKLVQTKMFL